jgi:hypothetical protein
VELVSTHIRGLKLLYSNALAELKTHTNFILLIFVLFFFPLFSCTEKHFHLNLFNMNAIMQIVGAQTFGSVVGFSQRPWSESAWIVVVARTSNQYGTFSKTIHRATHHFLQF